MTRFTDECLEILRSLPGLGFPMGARLLSAVFSRPVRLMLWYFTLYPRVIVAKNLSWAARYKGHIENDFHVHLWKIPKSAIFTYSQSEALQLSGVRRSPDFCRHQQRVLWPAKYKTDRFYTHHSIFHTVTWWVTLPSRKVSGQSFYCSNL